MVMPLGHLKAKGLTVNLQWEGSIRMGSTGNSLIKGIDVQEIIDTLDSFHAQSRVQLPPGPLFTTRELRH